jgi:hypothetical protein
MGCAVVMENEMSAQEAYRAWLSANPSYCECPPDYGAFLVGYEAAQSPLREMYEARHAAALQYADEIVKLREELAEAKKKAENDMMAIFSEFVSGIEHPGISIKRNGKSIKAELVLGVKEMQATIEGSKP